MIDSERYMDVVIRTSVHNGKTYDPPLRYVCCNRRRCRNDIVMQAPAQPSIYNPENQPALEARRWRLPEHAVVVSLADGTDKLVFCSVYCARLYLTVYSGV